MRSRAPKVQSVPERPLGAVALPVPRSDGEAGEEEDPEDPGGPLRLEEKLQRFAERVGAHRSPVCPGPDFVTSLAEQQEKPALNRQSLGPAGYLGCGRVQCEMPCVEDVHLSAWHVPAIRFRLRGSTRSFPITSGHALRVRLRSCELQRGIPMGRAEEAHRLAPLNQRRTPTPPHLRPVAARFSPSRPLQHRASLGLLRGDCVEVRPESRRSLLTALALHPSRQTPCWRWQGDEQCRASPVGRDSWLEVGGALRAGGPPFALLCSAGRSPPLRRRRRRVVCPRTPWQRRSRVNDHHQRHRPGQGDLLIHASSARPRCEPEQGLRPASANAQHGGR